MRLPDFLQEVEPGEIRLTGHRIGLYHVVDLCQQGYSAEMVHEEFPSLPLELVRQVLGFYQENKAEVDAYVAQYRAEIERHYAQGSKLDLEELMRRRPDIARALRR
jgi:uncharacterized protein (DUF433 family)